MFKYHLVNDLIDKRRLSDKNFKIQDLIQFANLAVGTLHNITHGKSVPSVDKLLGIAKFFEVDMNYFFDEFDDRPRPPILVKDSEPSYEKPPKDENPYKLLFEKQEEITDLRQKVADLTIENERLKLFVQSNNAPDRTASAG